MAGSIGIASESVDWPGYPEVFVEVIKSCIPVKYGMTPDTDLRLISK
jgi:hypothetical protein